MHTQATVNRVGNDELYFVNLSSGQVREGYGRCVLIFLDTVASPQLWTDLFPSLDLPLPLETFTCRSLTKVLYPNRFTPMWNVWVDTRRGGHATIQDRIWFSAKTGNREISERHCCKDLIYNPISKKVRKDPLHSSIKYFKSEEL